MFEASLITLLAADSALVALLSSFSSAPAIFTGMAPQKAEPPYIVFDMDETTTDGRVVSAFDIVIDIYDRQESGKNMRDIATRLKYVCDLAEIKTDPEYSTIRLSWEDGREVENSDVKVRHYVTRISARAGRQAWAAQL